MTRAPILGRLCCLAAFPGGGARTSGSPATGGEGSPAAAWWRWKGSRPTAEAGRKDDPPIPLRAAIKKVQRRLFCPFLGVGFFDQWREKKEQQLPLSSWVFSVTILVGTPRLQAERREQHASLLRPFSPLARGFVQVAKGRLQQGRVPGLAGDLRQRWREGCDKPRFSSILVSCLLQCTTL